MYRSSPFRSTLNTGYITGLDMCKVCTEAVHSVALWTRVTLQVWTCVKYIPKQSIAQRFEHLCKCKRMSSSPPHPTPPYPMWCVRGWLWVGKWCKIVPVCTCDSSLCARVTLENGCVRTWLQSVCAGDSGWKKWCKIVPVCTCDSRVCARVTPWPFETGNPFKVLIDPNRCWFKSWQGRWKEFETDPWPKRFLLKLRGPDPTVGWLVQKSGEFENHRKDVAKALANNGISTTKLIWLAGFLNHQQ